MLHNTVGSNTNCSASLQISNVGASDNVHLPGKHFTIGFHPVTGRLRFDFSDANNLNDKDVNYHMNYKWEMPNTRTPPKTSCNAIQSDSSTTVNIDGTIADLTPFDNNVFRLNQNWNKYDLGVGKDSCYEITSALFPKTGA